MKIHKLVSSIFFISILFVGCSTHQKIKANLNETPSWLEEENVGCSMLSASGLLEDQKQRAVERAIISMMMRSGSINGKSKVLIKRSRHQNTTVDEYNIRYKENGTYNIEYEKKEFQIEVINRWYDSYNGNYCVQIRRR